MKQSVLIILAILIFTSCNNAEATGRLNSYKYIAKNTTDENCIQDSEMYSTDLNRIEMYLYHKIYPKQTISNRFGRIERTIFRQSYPNLSYTERMNNILSCYQDYYSMKNYVSNYYSPNLLRRMYSRYHGYPTGLTPAISPAIMNNALLPNYNNYSNMYYGNRGYRYNNMAAPIVGTGIKILD